MAEKNVAFMRFSAVRIRVRSRATHAVAKCAAAEHNDGAPDKRARRLGQKQLESI